MKDLDIIPECYIDTNLVETLLNIKGCWIDGVNHQKGCNTVAKTMMTVKKNVFALGVIDTDKRVPSYVEEFNVIGSFRHISLMKHKDKDHFLLMINPAMDTLILACAAEVGIDLAKYDLTSELKAFTNITKDVDSKKDARFKRLFKDIQEAKEMEILGDVLAYLYNHKYDYKESELVAFFISNS